MKRRTLSQFIIGGAVAGQLVMLAIGFASLQSINLLNHASQQAEHSYRILNYLERITADLYAGQVVQRGYLLTGDSSSLRDFDSQLARLRANVAALKNLVGGDSLQVRRSEQLGSELELRIEEMRRRNELRQREGAAAVAVELRLRGIRTQVYEIIQQMRAAEEAALADRVGTARDHSVATRRFIQSGSAIGLLVVGIALLIVLREIRNRTRAHMQVREREERLNDVMDNATELINSLDSNGRYVYVNRAWRERLGYTESEALKLHYHDVIAPEFHAQADEVFRRLMAGERLREFETVFVSRSGARVPVCGNLSARRDENQPAITRGIYRDVTEEMAAERLKDEFLSVISHELRTPLTSIRGALGLLATGKLGTLNPRGERLLSIAAEDTERLVRMVNDLLDVERLEAGRVTLQKTAVDLAELVARAIDIVQIHADRAGVRLEADVEPVVVMADGDRILQTLTNLLDNAVKFSPADSVVRVHSTVQNGKARVSVIDRGRGIPTEMLEKIFDRFQQLDASDSRQKGGTGLGLAISRMIVEQHGGTIRVESDGKNGSTFSFSLPLATTPRVETGTTSDGPLILVAEDDANAADVIGEIVQAHGFRVIYAADGVKAVEQARAHNPAVVLLDLMMPRMNGAEVLHELRNDPRTREIPIVIASGLSQGEIELPGGVEFVEWLRKPLVESALTSALDRAVANRLGALSVLVVEDDPSLAEVLCSWLGNAGIRARHASTTQEALDKTKAEAPDLVVLDLLLPDGNGFEVARHLAATDHKSTPIIVYSALELQSCQRDERLGNIEFMHKADHNPEQVTHRIALLLHRLVNGGKQ